MDKILEFLKAVEDPRSDTESRVYALNYSEEFIACADDYAGGNIDDAYSAGVEDGQAIAEYELAQQLITMLGAL